MIEILSPAILISFVAGAVVGAVIFSFCWKIL